MVDAASLEQLWHAAQECANQNLRTAQAGWEMERAESEALCVQLSTAFDTLDREREDAARALAQLQQCKLEAAALLTQRDMVLKDNTRSNRERRMATAGRSTKVPPPPGHTGINRLLKLRQQDG